jgi:hypothetical protein
MSALSKLGRASACAVLLLACACGALPAGNDDPAKPAASPDAGGKTEKPAGPSVKAVANDVAVDPPGQLKGTMLSSDILVYGQNSLDKDTIAEIKAIKGVQTVEPFSMGSFFVEEKEVTYAAVHPETFRRFADPATARTQAVWDRVAGGEIAVDPVVGRELEQKDGYMRLGNEASAKTIHIGAYAKVLNAINESRIDAIVNYKWASKLGMKKDNAMLVALGEASPASILKQLKKYAGNDTQIEILAQNPNLKAAQTAFLTGGSVARAVGSFSYRANSDGTVTPDPKWVAEKITTEVMPIIGRVTGNRVMLPQLRGALNEVVRQGLTSSIYHYDGCYVPRFIAHDPSKGLSFHTFGTAIDLNAADNGRGGPGKMDRRVVAIFKTWGFAWGGDWHYTDPMHFELAKLAKS